MYSLEINFLNDRPEFTPDTGPATPSAPVAPQANPLPAIIGLVVAIALPGGAYMTKIYLDGEGVKLTTERDNLTTELSNIQSQLSQVETLKAEEASIQGEIESLVGVFSQVQPVSAILQEVSNRIPSNLRMSTFNLASNQLTLSGTAASYADLTDFLLVLKQSIFIDPKTVKLTASTPGENPVQVEVDYLDDPTAPPTAQANTPPNHEGEDPDRPQVEYNPPEVVTYTVTAQLSNPSATEPEVLDQLRTLGAAGLVERIEVLQQRGII